jgi:hypothetical protein
MGSRLSQLRSLYGAYAAVSLSHANLLAPIIVSLPRFTLRSCTETGNRVDHTSSCVLCVGVETGKTMDGTTQVLVDLH